MAINFPTSLDVFTDPSASDQLNLPSHSGQHTDLNNAVEALEAKVGADSSAVTSSHDYKIAQLEAGATGGKILQVVSTTKTDTYSISVGLRQFAGSNVTGLDTTITPSSATSKILVIPMIYASGTTARAIFRINRGGSPIAVGDSAGNRGLVTGRNYGVAANSELALGSMMYLDAPATTSATTYGIELFNDASGTETLYVNRSAADVDAVQYSRTVSTLTLLEVAG